MAAHAVVLGLIALHAPRLHAPPPLPSGPPEPIIPVLIMPRAMPPAAEGASAPSELRLHRRRTRFSEDELPIAPLVAPTETRAAERPAEAAGPRSVVLPRYEDTLADNARKALRGRLNCDSDSLSRAEREACQDRFAAGARDAPFSGLGMEAGKESDLARAARRKEEDFRYKRAPVAGSGAAGTGYNNGRIQGPGAPNLGMGSSSHDLGAITGADSRREAKVPF
ncbi:MAG: hypothetical protein AB1942_09775 [Pseudomonadota bacterium]